MNLVVWLAKIVKWGSGIRFLSISVTYVWGAECLHPAAAEPEFLLKEVSEMKFYLFFESRPEVIPSIIRLTKKHTESL